MPGILDEVFLKKNPKFASGMLAPYVPDTTYTAPPSFKDKLKQTWPAKLATGIADTVESASNLVPDAYHGRLDLSSPEGVGRVFDAAGLSMTGGLAAPATKGITLTSGLRRPPPAVGGYHGTQVPEIFEKFKLDGFDLGTHFSIDPGVAHQYIGNMPGNPYRIMPVVADIKQTLKMPNDPGNWSNSGTIMEQFERHVNKSKHYPRGLLDFMESAATRPGGWDKNFVSGLEKRGYDSIFYPNENILNSHDSFMVFNPKNIVPKFSPEGQEIIARRGLHEPMKGRPGYFEHSAEGYGKWRVPRGLLKEFE